MINIDSQVNQWSVALENLFLYNYNKVYEIL